MRLAFARAGASLALILGCTSSPAPVPDATVTDAGCPPGPSSGAFPCDVAAVLAARCQTCHQDPPLNRAPWSLMTYADTRRPFGTAGLLRWQRMAQVIEPDAIPHMPPRSAPQPSATQLATLRDWLAGCAPAAPAGTVCDTSDGG